LSERRRTLIFGRALACGSFESMISFEAGLGVPRLLRMVELDIAERFADCAALPKWAGFAARSPATPGLNVQLRASNDRGCRDSA
jgi:hypothetical protein